MTAGTPQPGQTLTCQPAIWSAWAGQQPTFGFGFDGFRWLLDGNPISGATAQTLAIPAADAGHKISCQEIVTYPLLQTTALASSAPVTVSPSLGASLVSTKTTPTTVTLTLSCQGLPSQRCTGTAKLTSHVTTQGSKVVAVAAKAKPKPKPKPKPPRKVTKVQTIASGAYSLPTGKSSTVTLSLNATGKKLLTARYTVPATLTLTGTASAKKPLTFKYGVIKLSPSYTWAFGKTFSFATELTLTHLPKGSKVLLSCHGHGCPFAKKTFSAPKSGKLALASALKKRHLSPHSTVDDPDHRAQRGRRGRRLHDRVGQVPHGDVPLPAAGGAHADRVRRLAPRGYLLSGGLKRVKSEAISSGMRTPFLSLSGWAAHRCSTWVAARLPTARWSASAPAAPGWRAIDAATRGLCAGVAPGVSICVRSAMWES